MRGVGLELLGLTIAGWSLVWFVLLGAFAVYLALTCARRDCTRRQRSE